MYRERNDQKTFRMMAIGFALICVFSAIMHGFLVRKKGFKTKHYEPTYERHQADPNNLLLEGGGTLSGEVVAVSFDRFFLQVGDRMQPFLIGELTMPESGAQVDVTFTSGAPPQALLIVPSATPNPTVSQTPGSPPK